MPALGNFLKEGRLAAGLKQHEAGKALGIAQELVSKYERNVCNPNGDLQRLCELYDLDPTDAPQFRKAKVKVSKKGNGEAPIISDRDKYVEIAALAAELEDEEIAMLALQRVREN